MKAFVGLTGRFTDSFVGNLRARYVGEINTVNTNYNRKVDAYTVLDMNFLYKNFVGGMSLGLTVNNMLDQTYFHPGVKGGQYSHQYNRKLYWLELEWQ